MEKVSVLLTVYNEEKGIKRVLDYLDYKADHIHDLVIVSDQCMDRTDDIILEWLQKPHHFKTFFAQRSDRKTRADAISYGLKQTLHDLTVIIAGDIKPASTALDNLLEYFKDPVVGGVTGHPVLINGYHSPADCLSHIMWTSHDAVGMKTTAEGVFWHLNGEMFAIRKKAVPHDRYNDYIGIAEDAMMGYLIHKSGYRVMWAPDVTYLMKYPESLGDWLKIRKRCCFGRVDLSRKVGIQGYAFYEIPHNEYLVNILKAGMQGIKTLVALPLGAVLELLCRIYYSLKYDEIMVEKERLAEKLWEPAEETKW